MSADGRRVAFMTAASPRGIVVGQGSDLFVTDMSGGVSRKAGTVELTREGLVGSDSGAGIEGLDLSADGRWLAITTLRTTFTLPALTLDDAASARSPTSATCTSRTSRGARSSASSPGSTERTPTARSACSRASARTVG